MFHPPSVPTSLPEVTLHGLLPGLSGESCDKQCPPHLLEKHKDKVTIQVCRGHFCICPHPSLLKENKTQEAQVLPFLGGSPSHAFMKPVQG